jgi:hypothetical protein
MKFIARISLKHVLMGCVFLLLLPAMLFNAIHALDVQAQEEDFRQRKEQVSAIDRELNQGIYAPFYLSPSSSDPCDADVIHQVRHPIDWEIVYRFVGGDEITCQWMYYRKNGVFAVDNWKKFDRSLRYRYYYSGDGNTILVAWDSFDVSKGACIKRRYYVEFDVMECYSEDGKLVSLDPLDASLSPLPPMLYWFFYR